MTDRRPTSTATLVAPHLLPGELAELRRMLEAERERLLAAYREDVHEERAIPFDEADDTVDHAEKGWDREEISTLAESEKEQLRQVEEALDRMRDGTYGRCLESGEPIPLDRLRAVPWARYRLEVQQRLEREEAFAAEWRRRREERLG